jgi:hypothetical protein
VREPKRAAWAEKGCDPVTDPPKRACHGATFGRDPPSDRFGALASLRSPTSPVGAEAPSGDAAFCASGSEDQPNTQANHVLPHRWFGQFLGFAFGRSLRVPPGPNRPCRCGRGTFCAPGTDVKGLARDPQEIPKHSCVVPIPDAVLHRVTHRLSTGDGPAAVTTASRSREVCAGRCAARTRARRPHRIERPWASGGASSPRRDRSVGGESWLL